MAAPCSYRKSFHTELRVQHCRQQALWTCTEQAIKYHYLSWNALQPGELTNVGSDIWRFESAIPRVGIGQMGKASDLFFQLSRLARPRQISNTRIFRSARALTVRAYKLNGFLIQRREFESHRPDLPGRSSVVEHLFFQLLQLARPDLYINFVCPVLQQRELTNW
jgi:hypothetical protein